MAILYLIVFSSDYIFTFLIETQSSFLINTMTVISHLIPLEKTKDGTNQE